MTNDLTSIFAGKKILITGGTGSLGQALTKRLLEIGANTIRIFSRNESKQIEMEDNIKDDRLKFFIGDVRDFHRLSKAVEGADFVFHTAALKHVPKIEYNPFEAIKTNVVGAQNVVDAAIDSNVRNVMFVSTDKAVNPTNLYGATKLCAERMIVQGNGYSGDGGSRLSCCRYGNVVGSRGSVIPIFKQQRKNGTVTITDSRMTRFWLTLEQGVAFVLKSIEIMQGGEIFVPKIPSMKITDLAHCIAPECDVKYIGIRQGEKLHEILISEDEARNTIELSDSYVIRSAFNQIQSSSWGNFEPVADDFKYTSENNPWTLSEAELAKLV